MRLLVAIPVHNERKYVVPVLQTVRRYQGDVLVVDDGSTDGTSQLRANRHRTNSPSEKSWIRAELDRHFVLLNAADTTGSSRWIATSSMSRG